MIRMLKNGQNDKKGPKMDKILTLADSGLRQTKSSPKIDLEGVKNKLVFWGPPPRMAGKRGSKKGPKCPKNDEKLKNTDFWCEKAYIFYKKRVWPGVSGKTAVLSRGIQPRFDALLPETQGQTRFFWKNSTFWPFFGQKRVQKRRKSCFFAVFQRKCEKKRKKTRFFDVFYKKIFLPFSSRIYFQKSEKMTKKRHFLVKKK